MPVIEKFSDDGLIALNWSIKDFSLNACSPRLSILSPKYELSKLGNAGWQLELFPKGNDVQDHVACYLWLVMDDTTRECDTYKIELSLRVGDDNLFQKKCTHTFKRRDSWKCSDFIRIDMLKRHHLPNDTFTIQCKLYPEGNAKTRCDLQDFEILSRDLTSLLESGVHHDLVLQTSDTQFKVHRCILAARWPTLADKLEIDGGVPNSPFLADVPDTNPDTLKTLIKYAYSGTLDGYNVSRDVFKTAVLYDFATFRKNIAVYPKIYFGITEFNIEHKTVIWHLDDVSSWDRTPLSFIRILPVVELYIPEVIIVFTTQKTPDGDEGIDVAFRLSHFKEEFPIFLDCKMSLSVAMSETQAYHSANHLFRTSEVWHFPMFIKKSDIVDKTKSLITIELTFCDGPKESRIVKTETEFFSDFVPIQDLRKLSTDISLLSLFNTTLQGDCNIVSKNGTKFPVHQAIIWARWPDLRDFFDLMADDDFSVELDIEENLLRTVIVYIYSGNSDEIEIGTAREILNAAKQVPFPISLEQKCKSILETALSLNSEDM